MSPPAEGVHRLCHQRQAADPAHAAEPAELPVPHVAVRGVAALRVHHHGHDRPQHHRPHDEGPWDPPQTPQTPHLSRGPFGLSDRPLLHRPGIPLS